MFTVEYRTHVRRRLVEMAHADPRVESAAAVGGSAQGEGDRWSDLDLTFGLSPDAPMDSVVADWTRDLREEFDAVTLFDLPFRSSLYRVFLFPGTLQVDLSFTPGTEFGPIGPRFALLFGLAIDKEWPKPESAQYLFGLGAHHAVRARYAVDRGRLLQAEYWTSQVRDNALLLACRRLGLEGGGRGFDQLPPAVLDIAGESLVRSLEKEELLRALRGATEILLAESEGVHEDAAKIAALLREILD